MNRLREITRNKFVRQIAAIAIVLVTLGLFGYYLVTNPDTLEALFSLSPFTLLLLSAVYLFTIIINGYVLWASLKLIKKPVAYSENVVLTGYSSIVNFFGPLQSGPGFRAAYLKTKYGVSLKRFFYATLVFYGFFALFNGLIIGIATISVMRPELLIPASVIVLLTALICYGIASRQPRIRQAFRSVNLADKYFWMIGGGALLLSLATTLAYYLELQHVDSTINFTQSLVYAAAANLALFVSLTPGAIGFRESFLLLSQQLHGIPADTVIAASIIDRAFYVVFLLGLFLVLLAVGARAKLRQS